MDFFTSEALTTLLSIIVIDLILAGDNAIVIGLAARNLHKDQQKKAIIWGTFGAIILRIVATLGVIWLLKIPGLLVAGGLILIWIAYKLLTEEKNHDIKAGSSIWVAIRTIMIADAAMGIDNVLAIAGAAHGEFLMVVLGLLISVPIVVWGSTLILKWMERFPILITIGASVLAWTAAKMIVDEPFLSAIFINDFINYAFEIIIIASVLIVATIKKKELTNKHKHITQEQKAQAPV